MKKRIGNLFLILGTIILLYVVYTKGKVFYEQQKLLKDFESLEFITTEEENEQMETLVFEDGDLMGELSIPKIDLTLPIVEGASQKNMKTAVTHLTNSSTLSNLGRENSNFAIAGHRSSVYGKYFNRLNELAKGDELIITTPSKQYIFKVSNSQVVKPTDVEVILPVENKALVTLITCHPIRSNKYRLIVTGDFQEMNELD